MDGSPRFLDLCTLWAEKEIVGDSLGDPESACWSGVFRLSAQCSRDPPSEVAVPGEVGRERGRHSFKAKNPVTLESRFPLSPLTVWGLKVSRREPLLGREVCKQ